MLIREGLKTHSEGLLSRLLEPKAWSSFVLGERCWHFHILVSPLLFIQQLIPPIETLRKRKREGEGEGDTRVLLLSCEVAVTLLGPNRSDTRKDMQPTISFLANKSTIITHTFCQPQAFVSL